MVRILLPHAAGLEDQVPHSEAVDRRGHRPLDRSTVGGQIPARVDSTRCVAIVVLERVVVGVRVGVEVAVADLGGLSGTL
jgi:hypothetical protein